MITSYPPHAMTSGHRRTGGEKRQGDQRIVVLKEGVSTQAGEMAVMDTLLDPMDLEEVWPLWPSP